MSATSIDLNDLAPEEEYALEKMDRSVGPKEHSSHAAMIEGCYKFIEVFKAKEEVASDNRGRFMAKALWKKDPYHKFIDSKDRSAEVLIRINPLINKDAECVLMKGYRLRKMLIDKNIDNYKTLFENKIIHLKKIELVENKQYNTSSYVYTWQYLNE